LPDKIAAIAAADMQSDNAQGLPTFHQSKNKYNRNGRDDVEIVMTGYVPVVTGELGR